jgi:hypothetical protein
MKRIGTVVVAVLILSLVLAAPVSAGSKTAYRWYGSGISSGGAEFGEIPIPLLEWKYRVNFKEGVDGSASGMIHFTAPGIDIKGKVREAISDFEPHGMYPFALSARGTANYNGAPYSFELFYLEYGGLELSITDGLVTYYLHGSHFPFNIDWK